MNLSRQVKLEPGETFAEGIARYQICFDFLPEMDWEETIVLLHRRQNIMELAVEDLFLSIVPSKLKQVLAEKSGLACGNTGSLAFRGGSGVRGADSQIMDAFSQRCEGLELCPVYIRRYSFRRSEWRYYWNHS